MVVYFMASPYQCLAMPPSVSPLFTSWTGAVTGGFSAALQGGGNGAVGGAPAGPAAGGRRETRLGGAIETEARQR